MRIGTLFNYCVGAVSMLGVLVLGLSYSEAKEAAPTTSSPQCYEVIVGPIFDPAEIATLSIAEVDDRAAETKAMLAGIQIEQHALELRAKKLLNDARDDRLTDDARAVLRERATYFLQKARLLDDEVERMREALITLQKRLGAKVTNL